MGNLSFFNDMIDDKLLDINVAYIAKVLSCSDNKATVQPLKMIKQYGKPAQNVSVVSNIPFLKNSSCKMKSDTISYVKNVTLTTSKKDGYVAEATLEVEKDSIDVVVPTEIEVGDLVFCVCADRNITEAKNGTIATAPIGHHSLSDSVIVGVL